MTHANVRDREAERARYAWERTGEARNTLGKAFGDYANLTKSAPALIMNSGLMQTIAFYQAKGYQAKGGEHHKRLVGDICPWLEQRFRETSPSPSNGSFEAVMNWLSGLDTATHRLATREAMSLLRWLKQFAAAREGG